MSTEKPIRPKHTAGIYTTWKLKLPNTDDEILMMVVSQWHQLGLLIKYTLVNIRNQNTSEFTAQKFSDLIESKSITPWKP